MNCRALGGTGARRLINGAEELAHPVRQLWVVVDLAAKGVQFEWYDFDEFKTDERGIVQMGSVRMAWLKDPEGNLLGLGSF